MPTDDDQGIPTPIDGDASSAAEVIRLDVLVPAAMQMLGLSRAEAEKQVRAMCEAMQYPVSDVGHA